MGVRAPSQRGTMPEIDLKSLMVNWDFVRNFRVCAGFGKPAQSACGLRVRFATVHNALMDHQMTAAARRRTPTRLELAYFLATPVRRFACGPHKGLLG